MNAKQVAHEVRLREWAVVMRERSESGKSIRSWCIENGITEKTYHYWQRRLRAVACNQFNEFKATQQQSQSFTEVELPEAVAPKLLPYTRGSGRLIVEIGELRLSADSNYPTDQLATLLRELIKP